MNACALLYMPLLCAKIITVIDGSGRLVVLKSIRDSVEVVDVPSDGLYFVRIGKESFKVIL